MNRLVAIAVNTFREAIREKLLAVILVFACLLIVSAFGVGKLSLHEELRVIRDLGLGGISLFGKVLAVVAGVNLVYKEIERKTLYAFIPKPIHRWQFVLGKYLGLALTLTAQMALMAIVLCLTLVAQDSAPDGALVRALVLLWVEALVVTAVAVFFSTFSTPFLSGLFTVGIFVIGRSTPDLKALITAKLKDAPGLAAAVEWSLQLLPDLHLFYVSGGMVGGKYASVNAADFVSWSYVASSSAYGALYAACVLGLAILIFSRRDFV
jgi:Cu-processing system permease protein